MLNRKNELGFQSKPRFANFFSENVTKNRQTTFFSAILNVCTGIKSTTRDELGILGSPFGVQSQAELLEKKY